MPEQKPAGDAQWTQQKSDDRAAEREAVRQFEKFAKEQDPRTDFQKASDARHEAQSRSAAGKGLAVLPNTAGDPLALAAALTRVALDKCQPAWKAEPVAPARKVIPVADRKVVMPLEVSPDVRNQEQEAQVASDAREFHIEATGANAVRIYTGTLFGSLPTGFSVDNSPFFELTSLANGDKIYAAITWDRRVLANGNIVGTITSRTIAKAASVPSNNELTATRYYQLATVTLGAGNIPVIAQSRWGPIDDLPGTARYNYYTSAGTTAQADYWDLTVTGKGKQADGITDIAPSYDSIQLTAGAFMRAEKSGTNLLLFARDGTLNSQGGITYASAETKVFDEPVVCETNVDVLVGLRLNGGQLQGQYKTITVNASATTSPEWVNLIATTASVPDTCP